LRLVVKAGSVLEDDDQRGLAHFVEHMQFQGSRHFPGQTIDNFLASIGLSIGSDANAVTSFDDTQYSLRVPTDRPDILDQALTVLEDFAGGALFPDAAIERQRAIVLAEWRRNLGADERTADKMRHVQLEGSRYADRSPMGDPAVIQTAQREQLLRFYRDWYRPDLMAVIVVGDVDKNAVAAMIRRHFSAIDNPASERPRPIFDVPEHASTRYAVLTDKESTNTAVILSDLRPARNQGIDRRLSRHPEGSAVHPDARRSAERDRPGRAAPVSCAPPPAAACFRPPRRATRPRCRPWCRTTALPAGSTRS
jgi:zinc protease